ncbi:hypothetical protein GWO43_11590 [candidate division KSB1 bacterium]|nr:hypothetical protein [candidate division KSB1 bacterium]NIR70741.1 hypothetical protein [candidate division KSB1 bacterium]NIS24599.1 hypothetical protein [candidate division KSB1 bacterium]NIT71508.1 hypothetical protein [candidate division KSB1 bacterium]NIU25199.1 hypothetical protein [candidate division KSB1 bacterium]
MLFQVTHVDAMNNTKCSNLIFGSNSGFIVFLTCLAFSNFACSADSKNIPARTETVYQEQPPTWFEDAWTHALVSQDGTRILYSGRHQQSLIDLETGEEIRNAYIGSLDSVEFAVFYGQQELARLGRFANERGWYVEDANAPQHLPLPSDAVPYFSSDGAKVAYFRNNESPQKLYVGSIESLVEHTLSRKLLAVAWSANGNAVYGLIRHKSGLGSLIRVSVDDGNKGEINTIRDRLDVAPSANTIAISSNNQFCYLALASDDAPDPEERHDPKSDRDLDIYRLNLATGNLTTVVHESGDDFAPSVANDQLYWTHNDYEDSVVLMPSSGGEPQLTVEGAQIPCWHPDGENLAFTYGAWRLADWALNLDAAVVQINLAERQVSEFTPIVSGYHEDFTPAWSADGRWIAYHSHRPTKPVTSYADESTTDDIYLRRAEAPMENEIRLTNFGLEVGVADWSPRGNKLVFESWERGGTPGHSRPWIATIDPNTGQLLNVERLRLPNEIHDVMWSSWSPKGDEIAVIQAMERNRQALWVLKLDGSGAKKLTEFQSSTHGGVDWMPDSQTLVYSALSEGRMQLFTIKRSGGRPTLLTNLDTDLVHPQVSPDGRWIACTQMAHFKKIRRTAIW